MKTFPIRLRPGDDLKQSLDALVLDQGWPAAIVLTGIGSLSSAMIRFADRPEATRIEGPLEILSLAGTLSPDGSHLHMLVSDEDGGATGGHLKEGAIVRTTAEIILGVLPEWKFGREPDPSTGFLEWTAEARRN
jgi:predicted DNA-binding protein with PD1-like motif